MAYTIKLAGIPIRTAERRESESGIRALRALTLGGILLPKSIEIAPLIYTHETRPGIHCGHGTTAIRNILPKEKMLKADPSQTKRNKDPPSCDDPVR